MSGHTPGPWVLVLRQEFPFGFEVLAARGVCIVAQNAFAYTSGQKTRADNEQGLGFGHKDRGPIVAVIAEEDANGRLIAAAPDMLAALKAVTAALNGRVHFNPPPAALRDAAQAIAKAEGRWP